MFGSLKRLDDKITAEAARNVAKLDEKVEKLIELEKNNIITNRYLKPIMCILALALVAALLGNCFHIWDLPRA